MTPALVLTLTLTERLAASFAAELLHAAVLVPLVALALRLLPSASAATRSILWTAVLLVLTLAPLLTLGASHAAEPVAGHALRLAPVLRFAPAWSLVIAAIWIAMSLARAISLAGGALRLRQIWRSAVPILKDGCAQPVVPAVLPGRTRTATLCLSAAVTRPSIIGFFSPRILIPAALYPKLSTTELDHIILHEMEHLRRRDDWRNLAQKLALVLFPLNPALLWLDRRLAVERELACDESVVEATHAPKSYATCLVHLAEERAFGRPLSLALGAWERRSELARRVHRILSYRAGAHTRGALTQVSATTLLVATVVLGIVLARTPGFVTFGAPAAAPAPSVAEVSTRALPIIALQPGVIDHSAGASGPHTVDAVARMPAHPRPVRMENSSARKPLRTSHLRRAGAARASKKSFVLTSWVVSFDSSETFPDAQPHFAFAIFDPSLSHASPQVFIPATRPTTGDILIIEL